MFNNFKIKIKELAKSAVNNAEEIIGFKTIGTGSFSMTNFIAISFFCFPLLLPRISIMFSSFIDEAIEFAVTYMKRQA